MTTENTEVAQAVAEAVAEGQQPPAAPAAPQYMTVEQVQQLLANQQRISERQIAAAMGQAKGAMSKVDLGLNAIRRDAEQQLQRQRQAERKVLLDGLDEGLRPVAERLFQEIDSGKAAPVATETARPETETPAAPDPWDAIYQVVEDYGLKRDAPGIDYAAFTDPNISDRDRQKRFMSSLRKASGTAAPAAPAAPAAQRQQATATPPESPRGGGGGYASMDALRDAYIVGKMTTEEYRQQAQARFGESV